MAQRVISVTAARESREGGGWSTADQGLPRRPGRAKPLPSAISGRAGCDMAAVVPVAVRSAIEPILACYLLRSLSSPGKTYIGFTVGPRKRLRQHNGEVKGGARRTRFGRPWEMIAYVHGFSSKVLALQFEWAWQNPTKSRFLKGTGALDHLRVTKRSFAASTRLQVLAALLAAEEFANEPLGVHVLRGVWAIDAEVTDGGVAAAATGGGAAATLRITPGEGTDKLEELLRRALAQTPRAGGVPHVTSGCPEAAGVLRRRVRKTRRGGTPSSAKEEMQVVLEVEDDDDDGNEEDDDEDPLSFLREDGRGGGEEEDDDDDESGSEDTDGSSDDNLDEGDVEDDEDALARAFRCPGESDDDDDGDRSGGAAGGDEPRHSLVSEGRSSDGGRFDGWLGEDPWADEGYWRDEMDQASPAATASRGMEGPSSSPRALPLSSVQQPAPPLPLAQQPPASQPLLAQLMDMGFEGGRASAALARGGNLERALDLLTSSTTIDVLTTSPTAEDGPSALENLPMPGASSQGQAAFSAEVIELRSSSSSEEDEEIASLAQRLARRRAADA